MIIRRKPTGILNRRRPIGSLGQHLLQRSVAQVRRMVISRLPHRHADWEAPPMVWNQDYDEQGYDWEAEEFAPQPQSDGSPRPPAKTPARRSGQTPSVQPTREDEPMPADLQAIYNLHKAMGRVTGESFLHHDAEPDSQKITKTPPTSKPVQASGRYEPPPQRPVTPRNAPPQPTLEPADTEPPPVQRRVVSKVEYMGVRNMAEEFGLAEPTAESADDFEDDSFEDMPDALPGTFEDDEDSDEYDYGEHDTSDSADYNGAVSAAIAKAEAPAPRTAPSSVQASPVDTLEDDPQKFTQTLIEQQPTSPAGEQAAQTAGNLPSASVQSSAPTSSQPSDSSSPSPTTSAGQTPPSSQPDSSTEPVDQTFASAPSVIEESENIQRKPADTPSVSVPMDDWPRQDDERRSYTADQLSAAIAQAEAPVQRSEPQVVRAKRLEASEPAIQPLVRPTAYTRVIDEAEEQPRWESPSEPTPPAFERRVTGQAMMGSEEFSPRPVENINYATPALTPPAASSPTPSSAPVGRVARMPETPDMPDTSDMWSEVPAMDKAEPTVQRRAIPLDEAFDAPPLPHQPMSLDEALEMSGTFTEAAPIQEAPPPVLMPPIGRTRHRDISFNPPSPESARPPAPSASVGASPVQRSIAPETVNAAIQRAEAPDTSNNQSEQGLLSLLDLPVDTPIQRDGPPMPNVDIAPSVQTTAIQRETPASPTTSATSGGTENNEGEGEGADKAEVEKMANEVYRLLQRRLKVERERRSR